MCVLISTGLEDPVGVISAQRPHFFLKASLNLTALLGWSEDQLLGTSLQHLVDLSPHTSTDPNASSPSPVLSPPQTPPHTHFSHFLAQLQTQCHPPSPSYPTPTHVVLPLLCADGRVLSTVSIHAFPILKKTPSSPPDPSRLHTEPPTPDTSVVHMDAHVDTSETTHLSNSCSQGPFADMSGHSSLHSSTIPLRNPPPAPPPPTSQVAFFALYFRHITPLPPPALNKVPPHTHTTHTQHYSS